MRVFDVCGTLYASNTTFDFIIEYHKYHRNRLKFFWTQILLSLPFKILNRMKFLSIRRNMIYSLKGESKHELFDFSQIFVDRYLGNKRKQETMQLLLNDPLNSVLMSASIDPVIIAISNHLNVKAYSSVLEYNDEGMCTGKLDVDLKGIKSNQIAESNLELVATDNMSDIDLIKNSTLSYIITNKNNKNGWLRLLSKNNVDLGKVIFL
ncbi:MULTISPECIES: haloacid dehalogenase-like hydrolase [Lelliottia]|jgi:phosphoserine phosphatase|uniref:Haloacid dehalogenase-like hydrolase n=1 Tax=Lelliottia aquatilis TaxID=2080838 RepID=A0ABX4ZZS9_9ENTR|nr:MULTISPECIES: haloacid dehalogenase-like hydrolase [Lelliottia]NTZ44561.1 hypothetical protein [Lelliottia aquatilis]POZ18312.1 hypothetical protein C3708_17615 [Lelliottia sp. 7254-16]POZ21751.1 hypothetical protein C3712_14980 [Lelliottia aquatilis]POZ23883.1 hypothetical protein C3711_15725 [Lelliottia aquatilis]POZ31627.1 hypothetical protein C3710_16940 [Lelliottia aquatilis]